MIRPPFKLRIVLLALILAILSSCAVKPKPQEVKKITPKIKVLLGETNNLDSLSFSNDVILVAEEAQYELGPNNNTIYIKSTDQGFKLFNSNRIFTFGFNDSLIISGSKKPYYFTYHNRKYSGDIILTRQTNNPIWIINKLNLESYLKGVVPAEIPTHKEIYIQADKAQAICARTYALNKINLNKSKLFHLYADVRSQVYGGLNIETSQGNSAVDGTKGVVIKYGANLATIYYHSTCGGMLESGSYFGSRDNQPYLQPYKDLLGNDFSCSASPYFRWQKQFTFNQLDSIIYARYGKGIKTIIVTDTTDIYLRISILERTAGGRIQKLEVSYNDTTFELNGLDIRKFFTDSRGKYLPSTMFTISSIDDSTVVLKGGGYGHGVGMCQYGALSMSEKGFKYYHILYKYFRGTYLEKLY